MHMNHGFSDALLRHIINALMVILIIGSTASLVLASEERPDAYLEWLEDSYPSSGTGVVRVVDHFMNQDSKTAENLTVYVYTEETESEGGITITVIETNADSGIFEGTVFFAEVGEAGGHRLHIADGDIVGAEYTYSQVPGSDKLEDMIGVGQEITITNSQTEQNNKPDIKDSDYAPFVSLDRDVYPVPFGQIRDFEDTVSTTPDGRSLFPIHHSAIVTGNMRASETLKAGDLTLHIRINDENFDVSSNADTISQDVTGKTVGPLKISVSRDSQTMVLAYAGGSTPNENGLIDVGDDNPNNTRQLGSITEVAADAGIFELDFVVRYTDGPSNPRCPATASFTSLNDNMLSGSEESRFDMPSAEKENYCIMNGDIITVEYSYLDGLGNVVVASDSAKFELHDGTLEANDTVYIIGSDMILTLIDPDLDLDNDVPETYPLDLIEWDSDAATLTMGEIGGEVQSFDPEPSQFRETGDSTGIFQVVMEIPESLRDDPLERGEEIILEYTDWSPSGAMYVGQEDEDVNWTLYTSNFGATVELDKKTYTWTDKVYITITATDHNFDSDLIDEIGNSDQYPVKISTWNFTLDKYKLVETGLDTGIFTGEVTLTGFLHDADGIGRYADSNEGNDTNPKTSGNGPTNGFIQANNNDGISVSFDFSENETVVGSALIQWNEGQVQWLEDRYSATGTGVVRVIDPDMNLNPDRIDNFDIDVWSDSDAGGIDLTVTETNDATGIFEGTVFFTTTDESSGHRLRVIEGDTITAEYEDNTLPDPYTPADELDITAKSMIKELPLSPLKQQMSGILPQDITCNKGLEKIFRYDGSVACASPLSVEKLIHRGWGTSDVK